MAKHSRFSDIKTVTIAGAILVGGVLILAAIASLTNLREQPASTAQPTHTPSLEAATVIEQTIGQVVESPVYLTYSQPSATISSPGATYIQPFFDRMDIAPGDLVTVSASDGSQLRTYNASDVGRWAYPIDASTAIITLIPADPTLTTYGGVAVSRYGRGLTEPELAQSVCGSNDLTDVICSASSYPTEYGLRQPVARLMYTVGGMQYVCTTWRVTPNNFMITNEHCIKSQAILNTAIIRFNYQRASCGVGAATGYTEVRGGSLLYVNATYDVALFTLHPDDFELVRQYGYLEIDPSAPTLNETIFIPQHPAGLPKQFGLTSMADGGRCRVMAASQAGYAPNSDFGYSCDTQGGSSGSPVIALDTLRVIGLHHLGSGRPDGAVCGPSPYYNQAVKMEHIAPLLAPYIGTVATPAITPTVTVNVPQPTATPDMNLLVESPTPTETPLRMTTELLQDGGFEEKSSAWVILDATPKKDKFRPAKARSGRYTFQLVGSEGEKTRLKQEIPVAALTFTPGDQLELIAHINTKGTVKGFMQLLVLYADGRTVKLRDRFKNAGGYAPRALSTLIDSPQVVRIAVQFKNKSTDPDSRVFIDDVRLQLSTPLR